MKPRTLCSSNEISALPVRLVVCSSLWTNVSRFFDAPKQPLSLWASWSQWAWWCFLFSFCGYRADVTYKMLSFCFICPKDVRQSVLCFPFKCGAFLRRPFFQTVTYSATGHSLILKFHIRSFQPLKLILLRLGFISPLWPHELGSDDINLKCLNNITNCGHRHSMLLGDVFSFTLFSSIHFIKNTIIFLWGKWNQQ